MPQKIAGTFAGSAGTSTASQISGVLVIPSGTTSLVLNVSGDVDANNQVRVQRSANGGASWGTATTLSAAATNQAVAVASVDFQHWRIQSLTSQAGKNIHYSLSAES